MGIQKLVMKRPAVQSCPRAPLSTDFQNSWDTGGTLSPNSLSPKFAINFTQSMLLQSVPDDTIFDN